MIQMEQIGAMKSRGGGLTLTKSWSKPPFLKKATSPIPSPPLPVPVHTPVQEEIKLKVVKSQLTTVQNQVEAII